MLTPNADAMRASSADYDKAAHDRLLSKANTYCLHIASRFDPSLAGGSSEPGLTASLADPQPEGIDAAVYIVRIPMEGTFCTGLCKGRD